MQITYAPWNCKEYANLIDIPYAQNAKAILASTQ